MVLSAGYGTRLWPLTEDRTKPAIPILGKPLVGYVAEYLKGYGVDEIVVNLHHRPESVHKALGDGSLFGVKLHYVDEPVILGTSGALDNARALLDEQTFIVINGKIITDIDLAAALATHRESGAIATLVLIANEKRERFSVVEISDGLVTRFGGMPKPEDPSSVPLMFTGIQILERKIFAYIPRGVFSHSVTDVYPKAMAQGERVAAHVATGKWRELSTLKRYLDISLEMLHEKGETISAGAGCLISDNATVQDSILWDKVTISERSTARKAVLGDGVVLNSGEVVENAIVVASSLVEGKTPPEKAEHGYFSGGNFVVPIGE